MGFLLGPVVVAAGPVPASMDSLDSLASLAPPADPAEPDAPELDAAEPAAHNAVEEGGRRSGLGLDEAVAAFASAGMLPRLRVLGDRYEQAG
ncbi:hypothetical protein GCM10027289_06020 [Tsukamurella serpentis]